MPFPHEHAARQTPPGDYETFRREKAAGGAGVDFIYGIKGKGKDRKSEIQSVRFDAAKFTVAQAKKWLKDNDKSSAGFEKATGDEEHKAMSDRGLRVGPYPILALADDEAASDEPLRKWVLIAPLGTQTISGYEEPYTLDEAGAQRIVEVWQHYDKHGKRAIFDWGHGSILPSTPEMSGKSGTILGMEFREGDGVYADVEFTPRASKLIRSGDLDQVSPEIRPAWRNLDTGEMEDGPAVFAVALTARPQLAGLPALAASETWRALAERFGMTDASAVLEAIRGKVDAAAKAGIFGPCEMHDSHYQWDVSVVSVDPEWAGVVVRNSRTGMHYAADIVDHDGHPGLAEVREGTMEFRPKSKTPPAGGHPEDMTMSDAAQAKALSDAQVRITALEAENAGLKALADAAKAAGADTPDKVKALAERHVAGGGDGVKVEALEETVRTLGENLTARDARIATLETHVAAVTAEKARLDAEAAVEVYARKGQITPAMRPHMVALAQQSMEKFKALADTLPVSQNFHARGSASGDDGSDSQPEDLHSAVMALAETMTPGAAMKSYTAALAKVSKERPDLVRAHVGMLG